MSKLNTINSYYDMRWGKTYFIQQKRYKKSEDAIFRVNDSMSVKRVLSKEIQPDENKTPSLTLLKALSRLAPREERVIRMRFGVGCDRVHTLEEVGSQFFVGSERIRQIEAKALRKLKEQLTKMRVSRGNI